MTQLEPVPAATVVLARESASDGEVEVLLLQRNARLVFHGGHWVFPGGRIDPEELQDCDGLEYPAALRAAVRETKEEAGIEIEEQQLIHTAHWTTPPNLPRRFSTWFFLCPLESAVDVAVDNDEILAYRWLSPGAALLAAADASMDIPRPTQTTLRDIAGHRSLTTLLTAVTDGNIRVFPENSPHYKPREMGYLD